MTLWQGGDVNVAQLSQSASDAWAILLVLAPYNKLSIIRCKVFYCLCMHLFVVLLICLLGQRSAAATMRRAFAVTAVTS